jgi:DNA gyrase subunit A
MGVSFVKFKGDDRVVTIARNHELPTDEATDDQDQQEEQDEQEEPIQPDEGQDQ